MSDIHIHRAHSLGLKRARELARAWAEHVEAKFGMACEVVQGEDSDAVEFSRSGVKGELQVTADRFELEARLGLFMGAFRATIQSEVEKELDKLLAAEGAAKK